MTLEQLIHSLANDEKLVNDLRRAPRQTLASLGATLNEEEINALLAVFSKSSHWLKFCVSTESTSMPPWWIGPTCAQAS